MHNVTVKFLKFFMATLVIFSLYLCNFISSDIESTYSILSINSLYNEIPNVKNDNSEIVSKEVLDIYTGTVTAYGPDCYGCSGITASGYIVGEYVNGSIKSVTTTYYDKEFGTLRVLAADNSLFPIGTVIRMSGSNIDGNIVGIVLDTGSAMRNAYANGNVLIDLLFASEKNKDVYEFGRKYNVKFEILRYGM